MGWGAEVWEDIRALMSSAEALNVWHVLSSLSLFLLVIF